MKYKMTFIWITATVFSPDSALPKKNNDESL